ncbi:ABC transporter ATP-binding protein [Tsukamurella sp. 8F]|uniref:ABC transporter ATP-binding protein n=1 Tax=unclassified Tsukamurella TaxID=2633480 RepID=UPI0023B99DA2|nr:MULTISPECIES: ABC transporter ATP-binding protein [unclassified Tsukamurella]MDF0532588.1 ABC transporter ATP-binding protein [Tsukamurella sp. 8J]MDF0589335.1 ABC transporter ATP-binding protein [Tsukamurella sp. 8F]
MRVEYNGVGVSIGGARIVHDATLAAEPGEFVGIVGPNGSGKSTLLRCLYRTLTPDAGDVTVDGTDVRAVSLRENARRVAAVTQVPPFDIGFSAREVVRTGRLPHADGADADRQAIADALRAADAEQLADRAFATLSGGEAQRVLIARAFAQQPRVLVLDEPTNHLDVRYQLSVLRAARDLGVTVVAVLHDLNLAAQFCDRLYVVSGGRLVCSGTPREVLTPQALRRWFQVRAYVIDHPRLRVPQVVFDEEEE